MIRVKLTREQVAEFDFDDGTIEEMLKDYGVETIFDLHDDQITDVAWEIVEDGDWDVDFDHCEVTVL